MENLERFYAILGVGPGATLKEIREAYKYLQEEYYPDYYSKDPQRQEKARDALREIYSAYKKLKVLHKDDTQDITSQIQNGVSSDEGSMDVESADDLNNALRVDVGQAADGIDPVGDIFPATVEETAFSDGKTDEVRVLTERLAASQAEIDRLTSEKGSVEKAAAEELAALNAHLESLADQKANAEKALSEAMSVAARDAEKAAAYREEAQKRLAAEVSDARAEAARMSNEAAAAEQKMREELAALKAVIERLTAEKESIGMAAAEQLAALKEELERTEASEQAAAEEAAAAKAEIADLVAERKDADEALAEVRAAAQREAERFAAERVAAAKEFAGQLSTIQAEVDRITEEKASVEKTLNEELHKARAGFEILSAGMAPAGTATTTEQEAAEARTGLPVKANPTLVLLLKGLAYGGALAAVCILVYSMSTTRKSADRPSLTRLSTKAVNTRKIAQPPTENTRAIAPAPAGEKQPMATSSNVKSPTVVSITVKRVPLAQSGKKGQTAEPASEKKSQRSSSRKHVAATKTAHERTEAKKGTNSNHRVVATEMKYQHKPASIPKTVALPVASAAPSKPPAKHSADPKVSKCTSGWWNCFTPKGPKWDTPKDADQAKPQKKYKVDMYPFARY